MDKLQWFKFSPSDWMMGKIMRCPEVTQARFIRICCMYWNNECELSYEDAEIELEKEHIDILVNRKIINYDGEFINIGFLDIQHAEIIESSNDKSKSGVIGNLKRWHPKVYKRFINKELSLDDALSIASGSHTDRTPITTRSQIIADKRREEKTREEEITQELIVKFLSPHLYSIFREWLEYRNKIKKPVKLTVTIEKLIKKFNEYTKEQCMLVVNNSIENNYQGLIWDKVKKVEEPTSSNGHGLIF